MAAQLAVIAFKIIRVGAIPFSLFEPAINGRFQEYNLTKLPRRGIGERPSRAVPRGVADE